MLSTAIVARLAKAGIKAAKPLFILSWPENQGFLFFYISQTLQINRISFMAFLLNAVL